MKNESWALSFASMGPFWCQESICLVRFISFNFPPEAMAAKENRTVKTKQRGEERKVEGQHWNKVTSAWNKRDTPPDWWHTVGAKPENQKNVTPIAFNFKFQFFFLLLLLSLSLSLSFCLLPSISVHRRRYPILNGRPRTLLRSMPHHNSISNRNQNIPRGAPPPPVREAARAVTAFEAVTVDDYRPESNFWFIFGSFEAVKFPENRSFAHFLDRKSSHITSPYPLPPFLSLFAYFLPSHPPRCSLLPYKDNIYIKKKTIHWLILGVFIWHLRVV